MLPETLVALISTFEKSGCCARAAQPGSTAIPIIDSNCSALLLRAVAFICPSLSRAAFYHSLFTDAPLRACPPDEPAYWLDLPTASVVDSRNACSGRQPPMTSFPVDRSTPKVRYTRGPEVTD